MTTRLRVRFVLGFLLLLGLGVWGSRAAAAPPQQVVGESYIIVFKDNVNVRSAVSGVAGTHGLAVSARYEHALRGMSAVVPAARVDALRNDPRVAYIEKEIVHTISAQTIPTGLPRIFAPGNANLDIDGSDDFRVDVDVAVIDTGVDLQHPDLNVMTGIDCSRFSRLGCVVGGDDDNLHGTHVAGSIAAIDNGDGVVGVAPGARIWPVKVLNAQGNGTSTTVIAGIDWVTANAGTIEVANMSLGGFGYSQAEYDAIQAAVEAGVAFAVAAGNDDMNAALFSPAAFDNVLTVSALADFNGLPGGGASATCRPDIDDTLADFSNWGSVVDITAPGVCILSTFPIEKGSYGTISGTSMASPHAAGALALLASSDNPNNEADVFALYNAVKNSGNYNWVDDSGDGIKEPLLDVSNASLYAPALVPTGGGGDPTPTPTPSPTPEPGDITLSVTTQSNGQRRLANLSWSGANGANVDIYRAGVKVTTTANDGAHTDQAPKGTTSTTYQVCAAGSTTDCSPVVTANW